MSYASKIVESIRKRHKDRAGIADETPIGVLGISARDAKIEDERDLVVIANTDDVDSEDEVVVPGGADISYFRKNGQIFVDHCYATTSVVGKLRALSPRPNPENVRAWRVRMHMLRLSSQIPDDILTIAAEGGIGVSIGFVPIDFGPPTKEEADRYGTRAKSVVRSWKWLELSVTAFPCNVACQTIGSAGAEGIDVEKSRRLSALATKHRITETTAAILGVGDPTRRPARRVIRCEV